MTPVIMRKTRTERVIQFPDGTECNPRPFEDYVDQHFSARDVRENIDYLLSLLKKCEKERLMEWAEIVNGSPHEPCRPIMLALVRAALVMYRGNSVGYVLQKIKTRGTCSGILLP